MTPADILTDASKEVVEPDEVWTPLRRGETLRAGETFVVPRQKARHVAAVDVPAASGKMGRVYVVTVLRRDDDARERPRWDRDTIRRLYEGLGWPSDPFDPRRSD